MGKIKRYKNGVERFLSGEKGQRFFNIAYSIGAAIVILGALFKILHLSGGDLLLSVGMGTEVLMFILTAFDRPPRESSIEEIIPYLTGSTHSVGGVQHGELSGSPVSAAPAASGSTAVSGAPVVTGGAILSGAPVIVQGGGVVPSDASAAAATVAGASPTAGGGTVIIGGAGPSAPSFPPVDGTREMAESVSKIDSALHDYLDKMNDLNRNIAGLNTMYELQLRGVSGQLDAFDSVSRGMKEMRAMYEETAARSSEYREEARKLTLHMQQLNQMYERMIKAMTHNPLAAQSIPAEPDNN
ncbi:MAG: gliding motility protein GldL [Barnesiella sp.]|nr:gliding motility protein GldL [Barnesiella sp.]